MFAGIYFTAPSPLTWVPNNRAAYGSRATAAAIIFAGGILATWFLSNEHNPKIFSGEFDGSQPHLR